MVALAFRAGTSRFALRASDIVRVLPARPLKPVVAAPAAVIGLLAFEEDLLPVLDLGVLLEDRATVAASRLLVAQVREADGSLRRLALLASEAWDMVEVRDLLPRLARSGADFLGDFVRDAGDAQLLELAQLLPAELRGLARQTIVNAAG